VVDPVWVGNYSAIVLLPQPILLDLTIKMATIFLMGGVAIHLHQLAV
jgi:hypothetical protein